VLAETLQATRDEAGALAAARHAIELAPEDAAVHDLEGRLLLAHEDNAGAETAFRRALALNPEDEAYLNNLALALDRQGQHDVALTGMEAATRIDPADVLVRHNVLLVARRRTAWARGLGIALAVIGTIVLIGGLASGPEIGSVLFGAALLVGGAAVFELAIHATHRRLSGPTAQLVLEDHRARRLKPWRWDWSWITRLRPWWWLILQRIPPSAALVINIAAGIAVPILLIGVPFSAWRAWRSYRRAHPGRGSWRPPTHGT